ncbi:MAG: AAA family ATPase [Thermodesulfobacteriota bacterium]
MQTRTRSIHQIVEEQAQRWQRLHQEEKPVAENVPVITISRAPGSGGRLVAQQLAEELKLDFFHQEFIREISQSAHVSKMLMETLDERGLSMIEDWVSAAILDRHLWPDEYLHHLMKIIGTIARHGRAVIVGRGANYLIPREKRFSVRIIAPLEIRVKNVCRQFGSPEEETRRRVIRTESDRKAFVRKYFNADVDDPLQYDLVINTGFIGINAAVKAIRSALGV